MMIVKDNIPAALLNRRQVAEILGIKPQTLANWLSDGRHDLPVIRFGKTVRYKASDVSEFVESHAQTTPAA